MRWGWQGWCLEGLTPGVVGRGSGAVALSVVQQPAGPACAPAGEPPSSLTLKLAAASSAVQLPAALASLQCHYSLSRSYLGVDSVV